MELSWHGIGQGYRLVYTFPGCVHLWFLHKRYGFEFIHHGGYIKTHLKSATCLVFVFVFRAINVTKQPTTCITCTVQCFRNDELVFNCNDDVRERTRETVRLDAGVSVQRHVGWEARTDWLRPFRSRHLLQRLVKTRCYTVSGWTTQGLLKQA